jgi:hypothetical protein
MAGFSIQDAALGGFAAARANPRALLVWTPFAFVVSLLAQVVFVQAGGQEIDWSILSQDPAKVTAFAERVAPAELAFLAVALLSNAFVQAAMMRLVFAPGETRFGYFRLGADELRQLGLEALAMVVLMGGYSACALAVSLVSVLAGGPASAAGLTVLFAGAAATLAGLVVAMVRLSLAAALTFETRRVNLFGSWRLTRGHFWPILGTYVLVIFGVVAIWIFANVLFFGLARLALGGDMAALMESPKNVAGYFDPLRLIVTLFSAFVTALIWPVMITPSARIYRSLTRPPPRVAGPGPQPWG